MTSVKINPPTRKVVEVPGTVQVTMSIEEAKVLRSLIGKTASRDLNTHGLSDLYEGLKDVGNADVRVSWSGHSIIIEDY